jgi:hypothetical protein
MISTLLRRIYPQGRDNKIIIFTKQKTSTNNILIQVKIARQKDYCADSTIFLKHFLSFFALSSSNIFSSNFNTTLCAFVIRSWPILDNHRLFDTTHEVDFFLTIYHFFSNNLNTFEIIIGSRSSSFAILFWDNHDNFFLRSARDRYCMMIYWAWVRLNSLRILFRDFCRYWVDNQRWYPVSFVGLDIVCGGWYKI